ncbi:MAG: glycosyltransferase family 2 protein [Pseudomonadota bacterium]
MSETRGSGAVRDGFRIVTVTPALDEAESVAAVLDAVPAWVDQRIVVDNGSTDGTGARAAEAGAAVVVEPRRGYGRACLSGLAQPAAREADVIVFLDADFADDPTEMAALVDPILSGEADLVIGSRLLGGAEPGALTPLQRFGNGLACTLMRWIWGAHFTDLGPFRAIRRSALDRIGMCDPDFGWTVEMQLKALRHGLAVREAPTRYRKRARGVSKVSGTLSGSLKAGTKILYLVARSVFERRV